MRKDDLLATFTHPGAEFRGAPFWAWNGKLEAGRLREEVAEFKKGGLGGFFIHSRYGLQTPYLSDEWFEAVRVALDEAEKKGLRAWLYDEDRWPSGSAGGLVTKEHPEFRQRALHFLVCKDGVVPSNAPAFLHLPFGAGERVTGAIWSAGPVVALFVGTIEEEKARDVRPVPRGEAPSPRAGESLLLCLDLPDEATGWHNGGTSLDALNADATRAFIRKTHEAYRERFGKRFGRVIPGIFTDEPSYEWGVYDNPWEPEKGEICVHHRIAWTEGLPGLFREIAGYDLLGHLPELVFDIKGDDCPRTRYCFHEALTRLFVRNYMGEIGRWCEANGIESTGHVLGEDTPAAQTCTVGSCMRCYEEMQRPGIDQLAENWKPYAAAKQLSSAARQFGRKWRLSETYGGTGWDFPFVGYKSLGDSQIALGVNFLVPHLSWYTMEGEAKRDYPASIFRQSPWWPHFRHLEDYFARVLSVMTRGEEVRDLLVIHPNESLWTLCRAHWLWKGPAERYDRDFQRLTCTLLANHLDFDYGDEEILSRIGRVETDQKGAPRLQVGKASYRAVVLPSVRTLRSSTLDLLDRFREAGGLVVLHGEAPVLVDALPDKRAGDFAASAKRIKKEGELLEALGPLVRRVSVRDTKTGGEARAVLYLLRESKENLYLFLCNTGEAVDKRASDKCGAIPRFSRPLWERKESYGRLEVEIDAGEASGAVELLPEKGDAQICPTCTAGDGRSVLTTSLVPFQSRLFVFPKGKMPRGVSGWRARTEPSSAIDHDRLDSLFDRSLSEPNVLVLDRPSWRLGDGDWAPAEEILQIDKKVRASLGLPLRASWGCQPWAQPPPSRGESAKVSLRYAFDAAYLPKEPLHLALEGAERYAITLNGTPVPAVPDGGRWVDPSLGLVKVPPSALRQGPNELLLETGYDGTFSGFETVYLLGAFDVKLSGGKGPLLTEPSKTIRVGDWCEQGLPFYGGNVGYSFPFCHEGMSRIDLTIPSYRGAAVRVLVDGVEKAFFLHPPCTFELSRNCPGDKVYKITIEVLGHRRNSHGPLHWSDPHPEIVGPGHFQRDPAFWTDDYRLVPCGLLAPPVADFSF